ncbi:MAG: hypothetical protein M3503_03375 [Actinomycetota bacterium]|nr:hypothetical protein [Actinomycetota bacterium]
MAIRAKLTTRSEARPAPSGKPAGPQKKERTEEEKVAHRARIEAAKDALKRSVGTKGDHVAPARSALKEYLRNVNEPGQPDEERFKILLEAPFKAPPKPRAERR